MFKEHLILMKIKRVKSKTKKEILATKSILNIRSMSSATYHDIYPNITAFLFTGLTVLQFFNAR